MAKKKEPEYPGVVLRGKRWTAVARLRQEDGTWKSKRVSGATTKEAWDKREQAEKDHADGLVDDSTTYGEYMLRWLKKVEQLEGTKYEPATVQDYKYAVAKLHPLIGKVKFDTPVREVQKKFQDAAWHLRARGNTKGKVVQALQARLADGADYDKLTDIEKAKLQLSGYTVHGYTTVLSMICDQAILDIKIRVNPCEKADFPPKKANKPPHVFTQEEVLTVAEALLNKPVKEALRWATVFELALRQGEALAIRWPKVDFENLRIRIDTAVQRRTWKHGCEDEDKCYKENGPTEEKIRKKWGPKKAEDWAKKQAEKEGDYDNTGLYCPKRHSGGLVLKSTKTDDSAWMPMSLALAELLRAHRTRQLEERLRAGDLWQDHGLVFCGAQGQPLDPRRDLERWQDLLESHGLPRVGTHSAKHTSVTHAFDQKVDPKIVSERLARHDSGVAFTLDQYRKLRANQGDEELRSTMSSLWSRNETG